jgi:hypothetical protein
MGCGGIALAIGVRGYALSIDRDPSPHPLPQGERGRIAAVELWEETKCRL